MKIYYYKSAFKRCKRIHHFVRKFMFSYKQFSENRDFQKIIKKPMFL